MPARRSGIAIVIIAAGLCASFVPAAETAPEELPSLSSQRARKLGAPLAPPYALVVRPRDPQYYNGVDAVALDPKSLRPTSRTPTVLSCNRVHASAAGEILCFSTSVPGRPGTLSTPTVYIHASDLTLRAQHPTGSSGTPSRARMSFDGRYVATTEFTRGHSYEGAGGVSFSTATQIAPAIAPELGENLEKWTVTRAGAKVTSVDLNLWGVTFSPSDSDRFYVTAFFDGVAHLGEGSMRTRAIAVLRDGVECPSFSPDGRRLAFKKRNGPTKWSPAILEVASMKETVFEVGHSVDDQIEWLDDDTLVYEVVSFPPIGKPSINLMSLRVGDPQPKEELWLQDARSPTFIRRK